MSIRRVLFAAAMRPGARVMRRALEQPEHAQKRLLESIVARARGSHYARSVGLDSSADFRRAVPIVDYDVLQPWAERAAANESNIFSNERIEFFERTSGSRSAAKLIPYTASLRRSFSRMFALWADDLMRGMPVLGEGRIFMSVSPPLSGARRSVGGLPIGLNSDADYLAGIGKRLLRPHLAVDPELGRAGESGDDFLDLVAHQLVNCPDLQIVSVWNPSLWTVLTDRILRSPESFLAQLKPGERRKALTDALSRSHPDWSRVWPKLRLISAWDEGSAASAAARVRDAFPEVHFQGKGLLATETPMTVPLLGVRGGVPLPSEVYYEFLDDEGSLRCLGELREGRAYELVLSTTGGLLRYRIGDRVQVVGRHEAVPTFRFLGRSGAVTDLVGEKLNEAVVADALTREGVSTRGACYLLARSGAQPYYELLLDAASFSQQESSVLAARVEARLLEAHHYGQARRLRQLGELRVRRQAQLESLRMQAWQASGRRLGDMKVRHLLGPDTPCL